MTYYLLPKTNHYFSIQMNIQNERLEPCTSPSLFSSYQKITEQLINLFLKQKKESLFQESINDSDRLFEAYTYNSNDSKIESISRIFHPYEYLFTPLNIYNGTLSSVPKNMEGQLLPINELKSNPHAEDCPISSKKMPNSNFSCPFTIRKPPLLASRREPEQGDADCTFKMCNCVKGRKENFYDFYEIIKTIYLFENFHKKNISILNISPNTDSINECIQLLREHSNDEISYYSSFDSFSSLKETEKGFDFIFYELNKEKYQNENDYIIGLIQIVILLLKTQKQGGISIIQIDTLFLKPILDIIYFISSLYQKTYIMKPTVNNIATFHKYLICKNFIEDSSSKNYKPSYCEKLIYYLEKFQVHQEKNIETPIYISSIIDSSLPCYFISKINDINIILGQQQLDAIHQIILFFKNKNKDKMNQLIKMHIYKSMKWCEKFKIPYNSLGIGNSYP